MNNQTSRKMKTRPYVGIKPGGKREVFRASVEPTEELYGTLYNAVVGPFKTLRGAKYCASFGGNNPHIQCVNDAERLAKAQPMNPTPKNPHAQALGRLGGSKNTPAQDKARAANARKGGWPKGKPRKIVSEVKPIENNQTI